MGWNIEMPDAEFYDHDSPQLGQIIQEVMAQPEVAVDTETTGLNVMKDFPLFWSLSWGDRRMCMPASTIHRFAPAFADTKKLWYLANAKYDMHMFAQVGHTFAGKVLDTQVMHALIYEEQPHGLKYMAKQILGWGWRDFFDTFEPLQLALDMKEKNDSGAASDTDLFDEEDRMTASTIRGSGSKKRKGMRTEGIGEMLMRFHNENRQALVEYASNDAYGTFQIGQKLKKQLQEEVTWSLYPDEYQNMWDIFWKTEVPFTKVLFKCERNGILIDVDYIKSIKGPVEENLDQITRDIAHITGRLINLKSRDALAHYFFDEKGYRATKMTKGGKTGVKKKALDYDVLTDLAFQQQDPVAKKILEYRDLDKLKGTYIDGLSKHLDKDNRIHCRLNQDVARCMPAGELVLTSRGYLPVEQVIVGDQVIAHTGKPRSVVERSTHEPKPIYCVRLDNGLELRTTGNHQYRVKDGWVRADALRLEDPVTVHTEPEEWRTIQNWDEFEVSSWGRVRNLLTGRLRAAHPKGTWGHLKVTLTRNGAQRRGEDKKDLAVHRLVLAAFGTGSGEVRHLNGIAWDNTIQNLRYGTAQENRDDALKHGTMSQRRAGRTKLTEQDVENIRAAVRKGQPPSSTSRLTQEIADEIRVQSTGAVGEATAFARMHGVTVQAICAILKGKTWKGTRKTASMSAEDLAEKYSVSQGTIRDIWAGRCWEDEDYIEGSSMSFYEANVVAISLEAPEVTYGLTVEHDHSHVTGGIVTHNTGRLSSSNPNLQNIPTTENDKHKIRRAFIAAPGKKLIVIDYAALEMRLLAAAAQAKDMIQIFLDGKDIHMGNAVLVFSDIAQRQYGWGFTYEDMKEAKKIDGKVKNGELPASARTEKIEKLMFFRLAIKSVAFGMNYGMKEKLLANNIGVPVPEAVKIMEAYMERLPTVKLFYAASIEACRQTKKSFTLLGRRRFLPEIVSTNTYERFQAERQAVNNEIQGSAAEVAKMAMINCDEARLDWHYGADMLLQIHDELIFECPEDTVPECKAEIEDWMRNPFPTYIGVPLDVSGGVGKDWASAK